ncbi:MAG: aminopeptidase [Oscillospiraceae bacterium]|jgi:aspartyl aminopeptidase|nr:aminopeptidase [Oscillospiraceae bacterium]
MANQENKKSKSKELKERLFIKRKNTAKIFTETEQKKANQFCEGYKNFLDLAKTEREAVVQAITELKKAGFSEYEAGKKYKAGNKLYTVNRSKSVIAVVIGKESLESGVNILASHIDSPRLDLKQRPLYEDSELAYFKTHYYGGIKKYQWTAVPLALHGVIIKSDLSAVNVTIGEDEADPVFVITDLLPHLAEEQYKRPASKLIKGEELNILIGSRPFKEDEGSELVKLNIMMLLNEKYGITEADLLSAELEAVPAYKARDIGFDRSFIGSYGQDDRVCAYTTLKALLDLKKIPKKTAVVVLTDKEEIGSDGNTGLKSAYLKFFLSDLAETQNVALRTLLSNSKCLSADVNVAFDPTFPDVSEKLNTAYMNYGVALTKYTGSRGKAGTSDASAEFTAEIRKLFDDNKIAWQTGELGKVDMGGSGTVAKYLANLNIDTIDVGVPVLSMHAPFEVTAKNDVYEAYRAFGVFIEK